MFQWALYAQSNPAPRPLLGYKDFGIHSLVPELEAREVHTLGLDHPVEIAIFKHVF